MKTAVAKELRVHPCHEEDAFPCASCLTSTAGASAPAFSLKIPLPPGKWGVLIYVPDDMCGDIDNRVKPILDLMVKLGLASDDRNVRC